ncbi:MAG: YiiX/YebB-like N1pC/P60 family cysteine hydrolase [Candidatus Binataceae bacterium]
MERLARYNPFSLAAQAIVTSLVRVLTKPTKRYVLNIPNDMAALRKYIRKGDVLLIEGNERISECIKYLTQSSWSHSALYVGDEPLKRDPVLRERLIAEYGDDANYLLVEALVEKGVVLTPLGRYKDFNIRLCRPYHLITGDLKIVLEHALSSVGHTYDFRNILDLGRYFFPVSLIPPQLRHEALCFGSGEPTRVICSSLIAECFQLVRFPILPKFEPNPPGSETVNGNLWRRLSRPRTPDGVFRMVSPTLITPRDFDLSPYFEVIKFNVIENMRFDYRRMVWAEDEPVLDTMKIAEPVKPLDPDKTIVEPASLKSA